MLAVLTGGLFVLALLGCVAGMVSGNVYSFIAGFMLLVISFLFWLLTFWAHLLGKRLFPAADTRKVVWIMTGIVWLVLLSYWAFTFFTAEKKDASPPVERLAALGYISWGPAEQSLDKKGVVYHDPQRAYNGLNLYNSLTLPEAYLMDMQGTVQHTWSNRVEGCSSWDHHVELYANGDLLVVSAFQMLMCLDWHSNVKWKMKMAVHHDASIDENRRVHVLTHGRELVFWQGIPVPIGNDYVVIVSPDGAVERTVSVYSLVEDQVPLEKITGIYRGLLSLFEPQIMLSFGKNIMNLSQCNVTELLPVNYFDILHTNTIEVLDRTIEGFCSKGDWLMSLRQLDLVGVVDTKNMKLTWSWGPGEVSRQHHPTLLENGNLLIYDNGVNKGFSRIIELDPLTKEIMWEYSSEAPEKFYSALRGGNQRLPNGNTLITESDKGRVFEITRDGRLVWEFYNPALNRESKKREAIYRMTRISNPEIDKLIEMAQ